MSLLKSWAPLVQASRRIASSNMRRAAEDPLKDPMFVKLKAKQSRFQVANGELIHVKGGAFDKILYQFTMGLSVVGLGMCIKLIYDLSVPKK